MRYKSCDRLIPYGRTRVTGLVLFFSLTESLEVRPG